MLTLLYFILILGITVFVHELGHFIMAKRAGVYVYEFALGMGPKLWSFQRKDDPTLYSIRIFPIGGFVSMAGEGLEQDKKIKKSMLLPNKTWWQKFSTIIAGVTFNFIFAFILLFIIGLVYGALKVTPTMGITPKEVRSYPAYVAGIREGDTILKVNNDKISSWDDLLVRLESVRGETIKVTYERNGKTNVISIAPQKVEKNYYYGFTQGYEYEKGFIPSLRFAAERFVSLIKTMGLTIKALFVGDIKADKLAGPVGIYQIVGQTAESGLDSLLYFVAFLSINVGFINLLPFPAFDGGRLLFLIIEKIKGKPIDTDIENIIHTIGFFLIIALVVFVTWNDIVRLVGGS